MEGSSTSWHYYPYAPRLVLNTTSISQKLSSGTVNTIDYSDITNNIIYAEGDISVSGIIPDGKQLSASKRRRFEGMLKCDQV